MSFNRKNFVATTGLFNTTSQSLNSEKEKGQMQKRIISTHLQEMALLLLAAQPIKDKLREAADKSRGRILADLDQESRELYLASRDVILEFTRQLAGAESLDMLGKVLQIVQGITTGNVMEYEEVKDRIIE